MTMPVLFVGHGSPMNAIENNRFTIEWEKIGKKVKPDAILMISAHWFTRGTFIQDAENPRIVNDMYGFPRELYHVGYQVRGDRELTQLVISSLQKNLIVNNDWGIDHGAWSVLTHMYPRKEIPVVQISIDAFADEKEHFHIGEQLSFLREKGIFIIGSGNIVHNLKNVKMDMETGYDWNVTFDQYIRDAILKKEYNRVISYGSTGDVSKLAVPSTDHFDPLLYVLGTVRNTDEVTVFNEAQINGSLSMTSYLFEEKH